MLPGGNAEIVRKEIEELIAEAANANAPAGAPEEAQADALTTIPPCLNSVEGREVLLTAESKLDGEPIIVFVVTSSEDEDVTSPDTASLEALVFKIADCSVTGLD
jgi:hypothetical protein